MRKRFMTYVSMLTFAALTLATASVYAITQEEVATSKPAVFDGDPYPLDVCPVSGEKLGSMGDPVVKDYDGREVRFCCKGCVGEFESNQEKYVEAVDAKLIEMQLPMYPLTTCLVMPDDSLMDGDEDVAENLIYRNRLVRFCCAKCIRKFKKDPAAYIATLDAAVIEKQREKYPLDVCIVAGGELGSMGDPAEIVVANRLVRFCCMGCKPKFDAQPAVYLSRIDDAWKMTK